MSRYIHSCQYWCQFSVLCAVIAETIVSALSIRYRIKGAEVPFFDVRSWDSRPISTLSIGSSRPYLEHRHTDWGCINKDNNQAKPLNRVQQPPPSLCFNPITLQETPLVFAWLPRWPYALPAPTDLVFDNQTVQETHGAEKTALWFSL